jgi:ribosomal protein S18 acetylase RimI-like enzyme
MTRTEAFPLEGGCDCRSIRYRLETPPLIVHCCHCRWCQRESGSSFALNALIEASRVQLLSGQPELVDTPSQSGMGQKIARCPKCRIAVWSNYPDTGPVLRFVRVGTLDDPDSLPPDIHIFTSSKQPWVVIAPGVKAVLEYYDREKYWSAESLARRQAILPQIQAYRTARSPTVPTELDDDRLLIRLFRGADEVDVIALWCEVFSDDPPWNDPAAIIRRKLAVQRELFLVGERRGHVVATVLAGFDGFRGWIYHLAVASVERRQGLGRAMMAEAENQLRRLGCPKINLQVRSSNGEAVQFYRSLGYSIEDRVSMGKLLG